MRNDFVVIIIASAARSVALVMRWTRLRQVSLGTDYPLYNPLTLGLAYVMLYVMIHSMKKKT